MINAKNIIGRGIKDVKEAMVTKASVSMFDVPVCSFALGSSAMTVFKNIEQKMEFNRLIPVNLSTYLLAIMQLEIRRIIRRGRDQNEEKEKRPIKIESLKTIVQRRKTIILNASQAEKISRLALNRAIQYME